MAVSAALHALPPDHPPVERIQFLYGYARPYGTLVALAPGEEEPVPGYVVFTYTDGSDREFVEVTWWHDDLTVGQPEPY